ncbi:MAG: tRNA (N(6)-L-threonylcarbamoyladenosine(37)-C(2))-methylthiotransferase MtaB [Clostridia bacterium]
MTVSVFTLGCKTNMYESEQLVALLNKRGYKAFCGLKRADIFVINSCAITKEAEHKSRQAVARARKLNQNCKVIVVGCASQNDSAQFLGIEGVTVIRGVGGKDKIVEEIENIQHCTDNNIPVVPVLEVEDLPSKYIDFGNAQQAKTRAFIKIQDGCNNFCSYCIVPYVRGRSRSRSEEDILKEVAENTLKEIILIGIDISQYGVDTNTTLADLFLHIGQVSNARIRLGSLEQSIITENALLALTRINFCPHFHLSLQSGSDNVLRAMNRHYNKAQFMETVTKIRGVFPSVAFTTDIIVGFPTETAEDFEETCDFVKRVGFADVHIFPYSPRENTVASRLYPDMRSNIKEERARKLNDIKLQLKQQFAKSQQGSTLQVLIEEYKNGYSIGYSPNYLRVYVEGNITRDTIVDIEILEPYKDGARGKIRD